MSRSTVKQEWFTLKSFRFAGRTFKVGQVFPWNRLSCSERRLRQLIEKRLIGSKEQASKFEPKLEPEQPIEPEPEVEQPIEPEMEVEQPTEGDGE